VDWTDARIIGAMIADCRISYNALAQQLEMTANAARARVSNLIELGVIEFDVVLSYAQAGADPILVKVGTESNVTSDEIIEEIGRHPLTYVMNPLPDGLLHVFADYRTPSELAELLQFVRTRETVTEVEVHTIITQRGKKGEFTKDQLRVLAALLDDVRKPITAIADEAGITARRARRALKKCYDDETVHFMSRWNPNLGDSTAILSEITWAPDFDIAESNNWLYTTFDKKFWYAYISASQPVFFSVFVLEHVREMEEIDTVLESSSRVAHADTYLMYPSRLFPRPRRVWLEDLIRKSGIM
jgi:DNA-binding Lrp family transcriptional regulator